LPHEKCPKATCDERQNQGPIGVVEVQLTHQLIHGDHADLKGDHERCQEDDKQDRFADKLSFGESITGNGAKEQVT
jgi:hypothetical protein